MMTAKTTSGIDKVKNALKLIEENEGESSSYSYDKQAIAMIFRTLSKGASKNPYNDILVGLTIIDSLYSTQMGRRYYGLEELARLLSDLQDKTDLRKAFIDLAAGKIDSGSKLFEHDRKNLFTEKYGIGKDGSDKGTAVSLISKYAYFLTDYKFPIYDSIAREMYPRIWKYCGFKESCPSAVELSDIDGFIKGINNLMGKLSIKSYDTMDRLLWTAGKIMRGNLSLVLTMEEYQELGKKNLLGAKGFDLAGTDLKKLTFLRKKPLLNAMFELAKELNTRKL
jgi:hypothetical protein